MDSTEMTDADGDALTLISRQDGTWVTCTSGCDEVTVGPFSPRLVRQVLERAPQGDASVVTTLMGPTPQVTSTLPVERTADRVDLASDLRRLDTSIGDPERLAEKLLAMGYRKS